MLKNRRLAGKLADTVWIMEQLEQAGAIRRAEAGKPFTLTSGLTSDTLVETNRLFLADSKKIGEELCHLLAEKVFAQMSCVADVLVPVMNGGWLIALELAKYIKHPNHSLLNRNLPIHGATVNRKDGSVTVATIENPVILGSKRAIVVEDVMTTGRTVSLVVEHLRRCGAHPTLIICLVDRRGSLEPHLIGMGPGQEPIAVCSLLKHEF